jgi:hypothetical protein
LKALTFYTLREIIVIKLVSPERFVATSTLLSETFFFIREKIRFFCRTLLVYYDQSIQILVGRTRRPQCCTLFFVTTSADFFHQKIRPIIFHYPLHKTGIERSPTTFCRKRKIKKMMYKTKSEMITNLCLLLKTEVAFSTNIRSVGCSVRQSASQPV